MIGDIKPIRSEVDYEAALAEVERLWGAWLGTPEGDRLDVLVTLIDAYVDFLLRSPLAALHLRSGNDRPARAPRSASLASRLGRHF